MQALQISHFWRGLLQAYRIAGVLIFLVSGFFHHSICVACCESKGASSSYYTTLHLLKLNIFITLEACSLL